MTIAVIIGVCLVLLVLAFLLPRLSRYPQRGVDRTLGAGQRAGSEAPGPLGRLLQKAFGTSRRATNKSAETGRRGRGKLPLYAIRPHGPATRLQTQSWSTEKVSQAAGSPLRYPVENQVRRCSEVPCVKLSGSMCPVACF